MAEAEVLLILALGHNLMVKDRAVRRGQWNEGKRVLGREPRDRVIGTVGFGNIAREMVRLIRPFRPSRILACDPYAERADALAFGVEPVSLDTLLRESDFVLINCPLTEETRGLIGAEQFGLMKQEAFFINVARGPIVDEQALINVLQTRRIRGAGLDVFEEEPLDPESPLSRLDNVILSAHCIGWTDKLFRDMGPWLAGELQSIGVEPLCHQRGPAQPQQVTHGVRCLAGTADDPNPLLGAVQHRHVRGAILLAGASNPVEKASAGKKLRPEVVSISVRRVERGQRRRRTAGRGDPA